MRAEDVTGLFYGDAVAVRGGSDWPGGQSSLGVAGYVDLFCWLSESFVGLRVIPIVELQGLDVPELGTVGYQVEDAQVPGEPLSLCRPAPGQRTAQSGTVFTIQVDGIDLGLMRKIWSDHCQVGDKPPMAEFKAVYPYMTTVRDNRFHFRGGEPEQCARAWNDCFRKGHGEAP